MLIANLLGLVAIGLIIWWFWLYHPSASAAFENEVVIEVEDGVYTPSVIQTSANKAINLTFVRKDPSPCAEMLVIPRLDISEQLLLNTQTTITLPALKAGEYAFHCQMKMYQGMLKVV